MSLHLSAETESRYDRQERITWWDQDVLRTSRVLVVGAGALGNELVKNLVLLGIGEVTVLDLDTVEESNLSRCVFFRADDTNGAKADVVAERATELNSDVKVTGRRTDVMALGVGWFADFDLILGGLDNREARAWVNQVARKLGLTWIDGAIEGLRGVVRVFPPTGACYECTLSAVDREILAKRQSCALLTSEEIHAGKVPTTASSASLVAAMQVQEAVKVLHGRDDLVALSNRSFMYMGDTMDTWVAEHDEDEHCLAHDTYGALVPIPVSCSTTLADLVAGHADGPDVVAIDFERDLVVSARCSACETEWDVRRAVTSLSAEDVRCTNCAEMPALEARRSVAPDETLATLPLVDLGLPVDDVITLRTTTSRTHHRLGFTC